MHNAMDEEPEVYPELQEYSHSIKLAPKDLRHWCVLVNSCRDVAMGLPSEIRPRVFLNAVEHLSDKSMCGVMVAQQLSVSALKELLAVAGTAFLAVEDYAGMFQYFRLALGIFPEDFALWGRLYHAAMHCMVESEAPLFFTLLEHDQLPYFLEGLQKYIDNDWEASISLFGQCGYPAGQYLERARHHLALRMKTIEGLKTMKNKGLLGERLTYTNLVQNIGKEYVDWVNKEGEKGEAYDIVIKRQGKKEEFIEVKTAQELEKDTILLSTNQLDLARKLGESYYVAHVILLNEKLAQVKMYNNVWRLIKKKNPPKNPAKSTVQQNRGRNDGNLRLVVQVAEESDIFDFVQIPKQQ